MTRKSFFAALLAAAGLKAQVPQSSENVGGPDFGKAWSERKPRNGQCPVCGEQAPPFIPKALPQCADSQLFDPQTGESMSLCGYQTRPGQATLIRFSRCSAAFWQDAGTKK